MKWYAPLATACIVLAACGAPSPETAETEAVATPPAEPAGTLNVYSARHYDSDKEMYKRFEEETGIRVRFRESGAAELLEAMKAEGDNSPADVILSSDAGTLYRFKDAGLMQPIESDVLAERVPEHFRDPDGNWFGLTKRLRVIVYDPDRVTPDQVDEYADLASAAFEGEVCMRSSTNIYNLSLMGELIDRLGADTAEAWARSVVANFARPPQGGDTTQIEAVAAGQCSVALVNHYYWVRLTQGSPAQRATVEKTSLSFPQQDSWGAHVNVTGAGVAAHAPHKEAAIQFIEWLTTEEGQFLLTTETKEIPLVSGAEQPAGLDRLPPDFKESELPLNRLGENQSEAQAIYDRAGWN
jgi:iron(III) transport system substrate-binding protein